MDNKFNNGGFFEKLKGQYIPQIEEDAHLSIDGNIMVTINNSNISINDNNELIEYPQEFCIDIPVYSIIKPLKNIKPKEIIKVNEKFYKITSLEKDNSIKCIGYSGSKSTKITPKDFLLNGSFVRVVFNIFSLNGNDTTNTFNGINPLMMYVCMKGSDNISSFKENPMINMMMLQGMSNGNNQGINPMMMLMAIKGKSGESDMLENILMMQIMQGDNSNIFGKIINNKKEDTKE